MSMKSRYLLASKLAQFLRLNGNKVLDGSCKLSLTTSALCLVNSLFLDVLCQNGDRRSLLQDVSMEELLTDVQFLYDFIKKATSLKLFHGMQTLRGGVDLSYFSNLVVLELKKIPTHLIIGLGSLSQQLKALICTRSIYLLKELFGSCSDEENSIIWTELSELNLSYNYLENLDHSLRCLPKLQVLDLSHNSIKEVDEIQILNKLVVVNLSYNQLDHLPLFNTMSCRSLRKLYIRNNNLEDLEGIDCIFCLEELDVSFNCLSEYHVLHPLEKLKDLKLMKFEGNPLFFHKCYRELVARYFHPTVLNQGIMLDNHPLVSLIKLDPNTTPLRNVVGPENSGRHQTSINMVVEGLHHAIQMPPDQPEEDSPVNSVQSAGDSSVISSENLVKVKSIPKTKGKKLLKKSTKMREALINEPIEEIDDPDVPTTIIGLHHAIQMLPDQPKEDSPVNSVQSDGDGSVISSENLVKVKRIPKTKGKKLLKKSTKMREAVINEPLEEIDDPDVPTTIIETKLPSHVETKLDWETKRRTRGEAWLIPEHSLINFQVPKVPCNTPIASSHKDQEANQLTLPPELVKEALIPIKPQDEGKSISPSPKEDSNETPCLDVEADDGFESEEEMKEKQMLQASDDVEVLGNGIDLSNVKGNLSDGNIYSFGPYEKSESNASSDGQSEEEFEVDVSEDESESQIFIVDRKDCSNAQTLFVNIAPKYIKERDFLTGKVIERLDLTRLLSAEIVNHNKETNECEVRIEFDTIKSKQQRLYVFKDLDSAKNMVSILQPFADAKILEEVTIGALECVKCNSQFSKEVAGLKVITTKAPVQGQDLLSSSYDSSKGFLQEANICPNCGSNIVIEMETIPIPALYVPSFKSSSNYALRNKTAENTQDNVSVGSSSSGSFLTNLFSTMTKSPMLTRKPNSSGPVLQTQDATATQLSNTVKLSTRSNNVTNVESQSSLSAIRRNSSDITVISNPSQSSIAVISEGGVDSELNTIIEKNSVYSLSSPAPENNTMVPPDIWSKAQDIPEFANSVQNTITTSTEQGSLNRNAQCPVNASQNQSIDNEQDSISLNDSLKSNNEDFGSDTTSENTRCSKIDDISKAKLETAKTTDDSEEELDENTELFDLLSQKEIIDAETFSQIDHRLKLHLEITIFDGDEHLDVCLESTIVPLATGEEFNGIFVLSSSKVYIVKILRHFGDDLSKSMEVVHSSPLNQLKNIKVIFGSQGFSISCGSHNLVFTVLVRDADLCNSFVALITDALRLETSNDQLIEPVPSSTDQLLQLKDEIIDTHNPHATSENKEPEIILHLFAFWKNISNMEKVSNPICIIVTPSEIHASKVFYKKQDSSKGWQKKPLYHYGPVSCQKMSDLLSLKLKPSLTEVELCFHNEETENESLWLVSTRTKSSLFSFISSLKIPWENIFKISLPLTLDKDT